MKISAHVHNGYGIHRVSVDTNGKKQSLTIPSTSTGLGSSVNGGELLFAALATCYCNDLYREAAKRGIRVSQVTVDVQGDFGGEGDPARNVTYSARVEAYANEEAIRDLMRQTDGLAEIQNSLRGGAPVTLISAEAITQKDAQ